MTVPVTEDIGGGVGTTLSFSLTLLIHLVPLSRYIKARHPSTHIQAAITPLFKKAARDPEGLWIHKLLYRINALLLVELGAAMALAVHLKAASVNMDDSIDCEAGVAIQVCT